MMIADGLYRWDVDLDAMTAKATPLTKVGLIGSAFGADGWSDDQVELVRDAADGLYKAAGVTFVDGVIKVRFNGIIMLSPAPSVNSLSAPSTAWPGTQVAP